MDANDAALQANSASEQVSKDETDTPLAELVIDQTGQTGKVGLASRRAKLARKQHCRIFVSVTRKYDTFEKTRYHLDF